MSFISKLLGFFGLNNRKHEIQEIRKSIFALEIKLAYQSKELFETQKILENISEILAQCVLEQNAISASVSVDQLDDLEKSNYASMFPIDIDDDDLLN